MIPKPIVGHWSATHAQFMMISSLANNLEGETYIYGHNNDNVFGALRHVTPSPGSVAYVYTANGHILSYTFVSVTSVAPDAASVLNYPRPTDPGSANLYRQL